MMVKLIALVAKESGTMLIKNWMKSKLNSLLQDSNGVKPGLELLSLTLVSIRGSLCQLVHA
jgi:hypothetical protein